MKILILHGINLNMFGQRSEQHYGKATLSDINRSLHELAGELNVQIKCFQSNNEAEFIKQIHDAKTNGTNAIVINAGAWTHYNYGIRDALAILDIPIIEVHMSNIHAREEFRHNSVLAPIVKGQICGFGVDSYLLGLQAAVNIIDDLEDQVQG